MSMINITLPDGSVKEFESGTTSMDIAMSISEGLARNVLSAKVDGKVTYEDFGRNRKRVSVYPEEA